MRDKTYKRGIAWIVDNEDTRGMGLDDICSLMSVNLLSHLTGEDVNDIADELSVARCVPSEDGER